MRQRARPTPSGSPIEPLERRVLFALYGPDISFGSGGVAAGPAGNELLAELPDGKILAVGSRLVRVEFDNDIERDAHRLNADGTIDQTFADGAGVITLDNNSFGAVLAGSRFYTVTGSLGGGGAEVERVIAYTTDGVVDTSFSGDGVVNVPSTLVVDESGDIVNGRPMAATPDGGVVLLVTADDFDAPEYREIVKLDADGNVDTTFGEDGFFRLPQAAVPQTEVQWTSAGPILTERIDGGGMELTRYLPDASGIDVEFGDGGTLTLPSHVLAFAEQPDGKLLFVRSPDAGTQAVTRRLYRLDADGSPDTSFGQSGSAALRDAATASDSADVVVDNQQRILVVSAGQLYRFSATGAADVEPLEGSFEFGGGELAVDSSGRVLRGGSVDVTRFDELEPVAVGRDGVLYVHGDAADDDVAVDAGPTDSVRVTLNGLVTDTPSAGITGITLNLGDGDNMATSSLARATVFNTGGGDDSITSAAAGDTIRAGSGSNVIALGDGNDVVEIPPEPSTAADPGNHNRITGGDGDKTITIDNGRATISLGTGNSRIALNATRNAQTGEASLDDHVTIAGGNNDVTMYGDDDVLEIGGNGNNKVLIGLNAGGRATVTTGGGNDFVHLSGSATVNSNAGDDSFAMQLSAGLGELLIFAGDGNDRVAPFSEFVRARATIHGGNGNDYLNGGGAAQSIYGGAGNDTIWGGNGSDLISAGGGNDRVYAEGGNDRVYGGNGRDRIYGGNHDDRLHGGAQGDWIYGQHGRNQLDGGGGHDRLYADYTATGDGPDTLTGGNGDDLLVTRDSLADELFGGPGTDTAIADGDDDDTLAGIEALA